jgi:hypothetical protein
MLAGWAWDVALLQEVPPWWPAPLGRGCGADARWVLTSRNALLPLRATLARRRPDLMKANGGGANVILVRRRFALPVTHQSLRLRLWPERRFMHAVKLSDGAWIANIHASTAPPQRTQEDLARAGRALKAWSAGAPALLGGDVNTATPVVPGFVDLGGNRIDRFLTLDGSWKAVGSAETLATHGLSDHVATAMELVRVEVAEATEPI